VEVGGSKSTRKDVKCGVPQGSVLGPVLFLVFINDLPNASKLSTILFADDTALVGKGTDVQELAKEMEKDLEGITEWFRANKLSLNTKKTKAMMMRNMKDDGIEWEVAMDGARLQRVGGTEGEKAARYLGLMLDEGLTWEWQIKKVIGKVKTGAFALKRLKGAPQEVIKSVYYALVESHIRFGIQGWGGADQKFMGKLEAEQNKVLRIMTGDFRGHTEQLYAKMGVLRLKDIIVEESREALERIRSEKEGTEEFKGIDGGKKRGGKNVVPRIVSGALRSWPSHSIPAKANKQEGAREGESKKMTRARTVAAYEWEELNCKGESCHCAKRADRFREGRKEERGGGSEEQPAEEGIVGEERQEVPAQDQQGQQGEEESGAQEQADLPQEGEEPGGPPDEQKVREEDLH
jgi:hypothetical protein